MATSPDDFDRGRAHAAAQVAKQVRLGVTAEEAKGNVSKIMVVGGKVGFRATALHVPPYLHLSSISLRSQGVAVLKRLYGDRFSTTFEAHALFFATHAAPSRSCEECSKVPFTFAAASVIAERIAASKPARCKARPSPSSASHGSRQSASCERQVVSNEFKSMVSYDTIAKHTYTVDEEGSSLRPERLKC